jgi:hypothetical protein
LKRLVLLFLTILLLFAGRPSALAEEREPLSTLRLKTDFNLWKVNLDRADWIKEYPKLFWNGLPIVLPDYIDEEVQSETNRFIEKDLVAGVDFFAVRDYLKRNVTPEVYREREDVIIRKAEDGSIKFDGFAFNGQEVDLEQTFYLIKRAYLLGEPDVRVTLKTIPAAVTVEDPELISDGIIELIATGETDYGGSPANRINNIRVGLNRYNGWLVPPGETASVIKRLGRVDETTGYLPELVIKGDKTIPEYGGGLCQVSTTVFRSILFAGLPITARRNHSYAVSYYDPQGLDATIYIPNPDLKFINDTEHHILLQTRMVGSKAFSNVYGTNVDRHVSLIGPYYYDYVTAPPARTEYSDELPKGEEKIVGGQHDGFKASWYRRISYRDETKEDEIYHIYSDYEARPLYKIIGTGPEDAGKTAESED